jgi:FKBP-type peptidyl-prolyl cis-trans isomerase
MAGKGDSVVIVVPADSIPELPPFIQPGDKIRFDIKIETVTSKEEFDKMLLDQQKDASRNILKNSMDAKQRNPTIAAKDSADLMKWIKDNNLKDVHKTASGLYYVIQKRGTGDTLKPGQTADVNYVGKRMDGFIFDSSKDRGPYPVQIGVSSVIYGWTEGLLHFRKGDGGLLIIPSYLAYGPQSPSADIPANTPLIFEISIHDVR